jgi:2'-5' RNA ligase
MIRAFIAIELPSEIRASIAEAQARLQRAHTGVKVSWTKIENLHLTLQFLGYVEEEIVPRISAGLQNVAGEFAALDVNVAGAGAFPDERRPRVLWVGCESEKLKALAGAVQTAMQTMGFRPEHREFSAHLTLGRVKFPRPDVALTRAMDSIKNVTFGAMRVEAIHLFQSELHPQGSIYTKLSSHQLGERSHAAKS